MSTDMQIVVLAGGLLFFAVLTVLTIIFRSLRRGSVAKPAAVSMPKSSPSGSSDSIVSGRVRINTPYSRAGTVEYSEDGNTCRFSWELLGDDKVIACVWFPSEEKWDAAYPWAAGRRMEIMKEVAEVVRDKRAPKAKIAWKDTMFELVN